MQISRIIFMENVNALRISQPELFLRRKRKRIAKRPHSALSIRPYKARPATTSACGIPGDVTRESLSSIKGQHGFGPDILSRGSFRF
ncbi:hypothetical protein NPIL_334181 [Nephila pilipes]|uniref:Uncharacterized protein n=1 Tax=Nephila pilipes TaxID=299642 RepID=A0A8X6MWI7_NEPPI|nr:hypothetical protein NPIL_334181 [Nephila pilipes]